MTELTVLQQLERNALTSDRDAVSQIVTAFRNYRILARQGHNYIQYLGNNIKAREIEIKIHDIETQEEKSKSNITYMERRELDALIGDKKAILEVISSIREYREVMARIKDYIQSCNDERQARFIAQSIDRIEEAW